MIVSNNSGRNDWNVESRGDAGYIQFIVKDVPDTSPQLLDNVLRILLQLLSTWRNSVTAAHRTPQEETPNPISVKDPVFVFLCFALVDEFPDIVAGIFSSFAAIENRLWVEEWGNSWFHSEDFFFVVIFSEILIIQSEEGGRPDWTAGFLNLRSKDEFSSVPSWLTC